MTITDTASITELEKISTNFLELASHERKIDNGIFDVSEISYLEVKKDNYEEVKKFKDKHKDWVFSGCDVSSTIFIFSKKPKNKSRTEGCVSMHHYCANEIVNVIIDESTLVFFTIAGKIFNKKK